MLRVVPRLAALALLALAALAAAPPPPAPRLKPPGDAALGFRASDAAAQRARETRAAAHVNADSLRAWARVLTAEPHPAGTPADSATAEFVRAKLASWGWDARIERVPVWLNSPRRVALTMLAPESVSIALRERGVAGGRDASDPRVWSAFHGYGASGDVTGEVVYANYGDVEDFATLARQGVDVRGKVALVRYGKIFRGLKVRNAERAGAVGVIVYSDPADDGWPKADPYPKGQARPEDAIQRGSVQFLSEAPGDPSTPGWPSSTRGRRLEPAEMRGVPKIPSLPIAYGEARRLLGALGGPTVPAAWQGALPFTYHRGPGPVRVRMQVELDAGVRTIWNVIATMKGRERPEQLVICGNHRDAWVYGAIDPGSGTIAMLEMGRAIGALAREGWRPRRTLMLASWDGEEYGLLGSTEWCEANAAMLGAHAVAYLNVDAAVVGRDLRANGSHALRDALFEVLREVKDPARDQPVAQSVVDRAWSDQRTAWSRRNRERRWRGEAARAFEWNIGSPGSGSDFTAFVDHLGVPVLDLRFEGLSGPYHSLYDDFDFLDRVVDPGYAYHVAMTDLWQRLAMRLAEAELLPLRYSNTGAFVLDELQSLGERAEDATAGGPDSTRFTATPVPLREASARLRNTALLLERRHDAALAAGDTTGVAAANAALIAAERALLGPGLPGRTWFRHELYAPGLDTGYAPVPLPRLGQAVLDGDPKAWARGITPLLEALDRATATLARAR